MNLRVNTMQYCKWSSTFRRTRLYL